VLRDEDEAAGLSIKPIHDRNLAAIRDLKGQELFQFAPKRARAARLGRVHQEERRFFHHDEVGTLRHDGEISRMVCARALRGG
jgi:hypothetical protein